MDTPRHTHAEGPAPTALMDAPHAEQLTCTDAILLDAHTETMQHREPPDGPHLHVDLSHGADVLVVCQDKRQRRRLCDLLSRKRDSDRVDHVAGDWRAIERVEDEHPQVVVLDLPPELRGIELVAKLRAGSPRSVLIVASNAPARSAAPAATALGASCYLQRSRRHGTARLATVLARFAAAAL